MSYSINPISYSRAFAVPAEVAEKHLKFADAIKLRVLLWAFYNPCPELSAEYIATELLINQSDAEDALIFWVNTGIFKDTNSEYSNDVKSPPVNNTIPENRSVSTTPSRVKTSIEKPTREEAIKRGSSCKDISLLLNEAQVKLGRIISTGELITLVWLHDSQGLPISVILMIIELAVSEDKANMRYIEKIALQWAQNEIDTVEKAEEMLLNAALSKKAWHKVETALGIEHRVPSNKELSLSLRWINEWGFNKTMLCLAYDACIDTIGKLKMSYIDKILENWHHSGIKTPAQKESLEKNGGDKSKKSAASYNFVDLEKLLMNTKK